jgi:TetR/AcrR family tetracycline transcriptional repressor
VEDAVGGGNGGAKGRLTRDLICEAALEAIDEAGLESVSMRMLASTLGVKASSLYYHFGSKEELMTGVAEFLYQKLGRPPDGGDWADQVRGTFVQLRSFIQVHPNAAPLLVRDLAHSAVAKKRANVLLRIVSRAGLDKTASASLVSNLVALLVGHSLLAVWVQEEAELRREPGTEGGDGNRAQRVWIHRILPADVSGLDGPTPAEHSWLTASSLASELTADAIFLDGLDALIESFGMRPAVPPVPVAR